MRRVVRKRKLIEEFQKVNEDKNRKLAPLLKKSLALDKLYIPTRYPDGLPDITPNIAYTDDDSGLGYAIASEMVGLAKEFIQP